MKNSKHKTDLILILSALVVSIVASLFVYFKKGDDLVCKIIDCKNNQVVYKLKDESKEGRELTIDGLHEDLKILIDKKGVKVLEANCPHKDCINTGKISFKGQSIICLYNKVIIKLIDASGEDIYL